MGKGFVLKGRFYYYSSKVRPTDQGTAVEKIVCYSSQEEGALHTTGWLHGEAPDSVRRRKWWEENVGKSLYCGFHGKEQER